MKSLWRVLFVAHVLAAIAMGLLLLRDRNNVGGLLSGIGFFWLGVPWSAAALFLSPSRSGSAFLFGLIVGPALNAFLLWRLGWAERPPAAACTSPTDQPESIVESRPVSELHRMWWLIVVPVLSFLFFWWLYQLFANKYGTDTLTGLAIAQMLSLMNCAFLFLLSPRRSLLLIWAFASQLVVLLIANILPILPMLWRLEFWLQGLTGNKNVNIFAPYLHPLLWLSLISFIYVFSIIVRNRRKSGGRPNSSVNTDAAR